MSATSSYDGRAFAAQLYAQHPEQATLDVLDAEDRAIVRLARDRFDCQVIALVTSWSGAALDRWWHANPPDVRREALADAVLERQPNPERQP